jgi:hypothetical protein
MTGMRGLVLIELICDAPVLHKTSLKQCASERQIFIQRYKKGRDIEPKSIIIPEHHCVLGEGNSLYDLD